MPYIGNNHIAGDHVNNFKVLDDISSHTATFDGSASSVVDTTNNSIRIPEHRFIQGQRVTYNDGASSSTVNVAVTVGTDTVGGQSTGVFYLNGVEKPANFSLIKGNTYIFDQSDNTNKVYGGANHPLMFSTGPDGDHNGNGHYMSGVVYKLDGVVKTMAQYTTGFNAATTRTVEWTIPSDAPATLYYWCHHHTGQGNSFAISNTVITGLTSGTAYFVSYDTANTIKLATSLVNANSNNVINLSALGLGTSHTLNAAFDGVNTKFKLTYRDGKAARFNNATQLNVAINNVIQRPNQSSLSFTEGFAIEDNHKIVFKIAPTVNDIFWGSIIANTIENFDLQDNEIDNFTGDGSTTEFTLSTIPANNESVVVSIDGVLQHPSDKNVTRAYTLIDSVLQFTAAPALNAQIQARHIGFAGATTADVSGFYGRTGNVVLKTTDNISVGDISTSRNINATGIITAASFRGDGSQLTGIDATALKDTAGNVKIQAQASGAVHTGIATFNNHIDVDGHTELDNLNVSGVSTFAGDASFAGNVSIGGTLTYEDVTNVDAVGLATFRDGIVVQTGTATTALIVEGNARVTGILTIGTGSLTITDRDINAVGVVTGSNFKTGTSNVHNVGIEVAQINVLGGPTKIGAGVTITNDGNYQSLGISTALQFKTGTTNVHNVGIEVAQLNVLGGPTKIGAGATIYADGGFQSIGVATAVQFKTGTTNVHSQGVETECINLLGGDTAVGHGATVFNSGQIVAQAGAEIAGIVTAVAFRGDGSALTGLTAVGTGAIGGLTVRNEIGNNVGTAGSISTIDFNGSSGVTVTAASGAAGIATVVISAELVSDSSPQLGGNLDLNSRTINGSGTINLTGSVTATSFVGPLTGNASTATKLATARTIGGVAFDGSANINLPGVNQAGNQNTSGNAATATNADQVDNLHASSFLRSDANDTATGQISLTNSGSYPLDINGANDAKIVLRGSNSPYIRFREGDTDRAYLQFNSDNHIYLWNQQYNKGIRIGDHLNWYDGSNYHQVWNAGNDGSGSGLDADTLDGLDSGAFLRSNTDDGCSYRITFSNNATENEDTIATSTGSQGGLEVYNSGSGNDAFMAFHAGSDFALYFGLDADTNDISVGGWSMGANKYRVWHAGNDGSGSGLDADLLDGSHKSAFVLHNNNTNYILRFGDGTNTGHTSSSYPYAIFQEGGSWSNPYPDLRINYHTGIAMAVGAASYGGLRFQRDYNDATELMSVGNGDNHVRIANNIYINGNAYIGSNNYSFRNGNNNRNMYYYAGGSGDIGISGYDSGGNWKFQLYGTTSYYGFLNSNWGSWDIKKNVNGQMELRVGSSNYTVWHNGNLPSYDTGANANTIVRRDGSGHIQANHFYSVCGDMGSSLPDRFYCSYDNYHRKIDYGTMRSLMNAGGMGRYNGREQSTSDSNYWTGSMGWGSTDFNTIFDYGSGSIDVWSNPSNQPSGTSHWVGSQHLHYTNVSSRYGHQIVVGAGNPDLMYVRGVWGGGFTSWRKILNDNNASSVLSSSSILYIDVYSTGSTSDRNTANSWAQSAVSIPNDCLYIVRYYYTHSYWVGNHTGTSHEDRRTVFYKNSSGSTYWAGVDRS